MDMHDLPKHKLQRPVWVNLPNGLRASRRSYRSYTHAVAVQHPTEPDQWCVVRWCASYEMAAAIVRERKSARSRVDGVRRSLSVEHALVLPVVDSDSVVLRASTAPTVRP